MSWVALPTSTEEYAVFSDGDPHELLNPTILSHSCAADTLEEWQATGNPAARALQRALEADSSGFLWHAGAETFTLNERVLVLGILNVTPDSFYDGGRYAQRERAVARGMQMAEEGADIVDVGGESTRPNACAVTLEEEKRRVLPVVEELANRGVRVSIDTQHATVAQAALECGACVINDVTGFRSNEMISVMASSDAGGIVMHMQGEPRTMQRKPTYSWATGEVALFLAGALDRLSRAGVDEHRLVVDPGIGFGKTVEHNLELLKNIGLLRGLGRPVLLGVSRKSFIGHILDLPVEQRLEGSLASASAAVMRGARVIRVHDVLPTVRAVRILERLL